MPERPFLGHLLIFRAFLQAAHQFQTNCVNIGIILLLITYFQQLKLYTHASTFKPG